MGRRDDDGEDIVDGPSISFLPRPLIAVTSGTVPPIGHSPSGTPKPDRGTSIAEITPALNAAGLELHRTPIHQARGGTTAATLMITKGPPLLCTANTTQTVRDREYMDHTFVYDPSARFQHYCGVIIDNRPDGMRRWLCNADRMSPQKLRDIVAEYFGHSLYVLNAYEIRRV